MKLHEMKKGDLVHDVGDPVFSHAVVTHVMKTRVKLLRRDGKHVVYDAAHARLFLRHEP